MRKEFLSHLPRGLIGLPKGAIIATIEKNDQRICIVGTHLQAGAEKAAFNIRNTQINEISSAVNEVDSNIVLIYAGDFNIRNEGRMFSLFKEKLNFKNPGFWRKARLRQPQTLVITTFTREKASPHGLILF